MSFIAPSSSFLISSSMELSPFSILQLINDICSTLLVLNIWNRYVCYSDQFFFFCEPLKYLVFCSFTLNQKCID